jgi:predicted MPP superfamily phosphohydrolase
MRWPKSIRSLAREDGNTGFVTTGTGTSILPVRFLEPPEVSVPNVRA